MICIIFTIFLLAMILIIRSFTFTFCLILQLLQSLKSLGQTGSASRKIQTVLKNHLANWHLSRKPRTVLKSPGQLAITRKDQDSLRKIGYHLEKSTQFWNCPKNWKIFGKSGLFWNRPENVNCYGKIQTVVKLSRKWMGNDLEKSGQFIRFFWYTAKKFPGSNATLLPRFLHLWLMKTARIVDGNLGKLHWWSNFCRDLNIHFGQDFEAYVWSRFWSYILIILCYDFNPLVRALFSPLLTLGHF